MKLSINLVIVALLGKAGAFVPVHNGVQKMSTKLSMAADDEEGPVLNKWSR